MSPPPQPAAGSRPADLDPDPQRLPPGRPVPALPRPEAGKNRSGSQSKQAARDSQLGGLALAAAMSTDITGLLRRSLAGALDGRHRRRLGWMVLTAAGCCA